MFNVTKNISTFAFNQLIFNVYQSKTSIFALGKGLIFNDIMKDVEPFFI
jgi:hypothetical protein